MAGKKNPDPDEQARKQRADRIQESIDRLKKAPPGHGGAPGKETPREFIERRRHELGLDKEENQDES